MFFVRLPPSAHDCISVIKGHLPCFPKVFGFGVGNTEGWYLVLLETLYQVGLPIGLRPAAEVLQ